jgi:adenosyl cobinamide kinase/adenosyl cobinamide phosphate guanylyltransferase
VYVTSCQFHNNHHYQKKKKIKINRTRKSVSWQEEAVQCNLFNVCCHHNIIYNFIIFSDIGTCLTHSLMSSSSTMRRARASLLCHKTFFSISLSLSLSLCMFFFQAQFDGKSTFALLF